MKELNYIFLEMDSVLNSFGFFQSDYSKDGIIDIFNSAFNLNGMLDKQDIEVFLFYPTNKYKVRYEDYMNIYSELINDLIQKYPNYETDFKNHNVKKIENSLIEDVDKNLFNFAVNVYHFAKKAMPLSIYAFNYEEFEDLIMKNYPNVNKVKHIGLRDLPNNICSQYGLDDILYSTIFEMQKFCAPNDYQLNISLLSTSRQYVLSNLLFENTLESLNFQFYRIVKNKNGLNLEQENKEFILHSLNKMYDLECLDGALYDYLNNINSQGLSPINHFSFYEKILKMLEIFVLGLNNNSGNKLKLPLKSFGIKKYDTLSKSYISPAHLINIYDSVDEKTKKLLPLHLLKLGVKIAEINQFKQIETNQIMAYLKSTK